MGNAYTILYSLHRTYKTFIKMETKDRIRDFSMGTRDLLNQVIGIVGLQTMTRYKILYCGGDGATVVQLPEGLQKTKFNNERTRMKIHSSSLLKTNVVSYCKRPTLSRNISSKALNDIEIYKEAYNIIKSKPGNMTP